MAMDAQAIFRGFVTASSEPVLVLDGERNITCASGTVQSVLGYSPREMQGRPLFEFAADPGPLGANLAKVGRGETIHGFKSALIGKDHALVRARINAAPVPGDDGSAAEAIVVVLLADDRRRGPGPLETGSDP